MIIDGTAIADKIQQELKQVIHGLRSPKPKLAVILVGNHIPSQIYVNRKAKACENVGIELVKLHLDQDITQENLLMQLHTLNEDASVDGILIQLPLPEHINTKHIIDQIAPKKDVDGLHPLNVGKLLVGDEEGFAPCTPLGIKTLLEKSSIDVAGKHVVILGRSNLVGKPTACLLLQNQKGANATVTIAHSRSKNIAELCLLADVLIAAIGKPRFVTAEMVKKGAVVIDVGINKEISLTDSKGYRIVGDVDFENVKDKCSFITPVPGGVGPMTIAMLLSNTLKANSCR